MNLQTRQLVERFYDDVWNQADPNAARELLHADFRFRGSLGPERRGREGFIDYMQSVHAALGDYQCIIDDILGSGDRSAARMTFRGVHKGMFFGVAATGKFIEWAGAAFFTVRDDQLAEIWVLGDVDAIKRQLRGGGDAA